MNGNLDSTNRPYSRDRDFLRFWIGETVSSGGSALFNLALPLTAVLVLQATAFEMGLLRAVGTIPIILLGLFVGVWVDRLPRRPIIIVTNLGQAFLIALIPLTALLGIIRIEVLYAIVLAVGALGVFSFVAAQSYLPTLVRQEGLVEANSKLQLSQSAAGIGAPGVGGWLIELVSAPLVILLYSVSLIISAVMTGLIQKPEPAQQRSVNQGDVWREIGEGIRLIWRQPLLRFLVVAPGVASLGWGVQSAVFVLFVVQDLGVTPAMLGLISAIGGIGAFAGAALSAEVTRRFGPGLSIVLGQLLITTGSVLIAVTGGPLTVALPLLGLSADLQWIGTRIWSVNDVALRQALTPADLLGRINATRRVVVHGIAPIGALVGGVLGTVFDLRMALTVGAAMVLIALIATVYSPLRSLRQLPDSGRG